MRMKQTWMKQWLHLGLGFGWFECGFHQKSSEVEELELRSGICLHRACVAVILTSISTLYT